MVQLLPGDIDKVRYNNVHDIEMRLTGSIVRFEGDPVYVNGTTGAGFEIELENLHPEKGSKRFRIDSNSPALDISSPPIGYTNLGTYSGFAYRSPLRRQKQGLDLAALKYKYPIQLEPQRKSPNIKAALGAAILNKYPAVEKCFSHGGLAFSREYSIHLSPSSRKFFLGYYGDIIGMFPDDSLEVILIDKFRKVPIMNDLHQFGIKA